MSTPLPANTARTAVTRAVQLVCALVLALPQLAVTAAWGAPEPACTPAGLPKPAANPANVDLSKLAAPIAGNITGNGVSVPVGSTVKLSATTTIVGVGNISINGTLELPSGANPGTPSADLIIVSQKGNITVTGAIRGGAAADGKFVSQSRKIAAYKVNGDPGSDGGYILLIAANIDIQGEITGSAGGGSKMAQGTGGAPTVQGGTGGAGGHLVLCAKDTIHIAAGAQPRVVGGEGGSGGGAVAGATRGNAATATGGTGGDGGNVRFEGNGVQVLLDGSAAGGKGQHGGAAGAVGGSDKGRGGPATATGGAGGTGGTVKFVGQGLIVTPKAGTAIAGDGGGGLAGNANGGTGEDALVGNGDPGGGATATGGDGGPSGALPVMPVNPAPATKNGAAGKNGGGAAAVAVPGSGGAGGPLGAAGGPGPGTATGGNNGGKTGAPVTATSVAGAPATSNGVP